MSTVQEIEAAIKRLPREEFLKLHARLQRRFEDERDQQMKADAKAAPPPPGRRLSSNVSRKT